MEYEDDSASENNYVDLQHNNNLDNGQKLKNVLMIHIFCLYIFMNVAKAEVNDVLAQCPTSVLCTTQKSSLILEFSNSFREIF